MPVEILWHLRRYEAAGKIEGRRYRTVKAAGYNSRFLTLETFYRRHAAAGRCRCPQASDGIYTAPLQRDAMINSIVCALSDTT